MKKYAGNAAVAVGVAAIVLWLFWPRGPDWEAERVRVDRQVEEILAPSGRRQDAIAFFESGGAFIDIEDETSAHVDRDVILPLLIELRDQYGAASYVVSSPDDPEYAVGLFVHLPGNSVLHDGIESAIAAADDSYSGVILRAFGNEWLSLDALTEEQAAALGLREAE